MITTDIIIYTTTVNCSTPELNSVIGLRFKFLLFEFIIFPNIIGDYYTNSTANALEWQIMISNAAQLNLYNVTGGYIISTIASGFSAGAWINVVVSRINSTITMYSNTNSIATATNTTTFGSATGNLNIGIDGNNSSEPFTGNIANVLIYKNKGLTASEVLQNYNATKGRYNL